MPARRKVARLNSRKFSVPAVTRNRGVVILHNVPGLGTPGWHESDAGVLDQVQHVRAALRTLGEPCHVVGVRDLADVVRVVRRTRADVVFNLVEALRSPDTAVLVPTVCRSYGKGCTGGSSWALQLTQHKQQTKELLAAVGLPIPHGVVVPPGAPVPTHDVPDGRLIVKPLATDASEGVTAASVCDGPGQRLTRAVHAIHQQFRQPALVEEFFGTRELQAALMETHDGVRLLTIAEIDFSAFPPDKPRIVDYAAKWLEHSFEFHHTPRVIPAPVPRAVWQRMADAAKRAWQITDCHDYARVDFRLDARGRFVILEVNVNPDIAPDAGYVAALAAANISFPEFVGTLIDNARRRMLR